jgi:hypothetical protein
MLKTDPSTYLICVFSRKYNQRFKGEKKSHERGPAIKQLTPNGISELFLINIFEINVIALENDDEMHLIF